MTFVISSKKPEKKTASISFSGSELLKFGFNVGSNVAVDISKGRIIISLIAPAAAKKESDILMLENHL